VTTLELIFTNAQGKTVRLAIPDPKQPVDPAQINATMDLIIQRNVFASNGGDLVGKAGARIVERNVTEITL